MPDTDEPPVPVTWKSERDDPLPDTDELVVPVMSALRSLGEGRLETIVSALDVPSATDPHDRKVLEMRVDEALSLLAENGYARYGEHDRWEATDKALAASEEEVAQLWTSTFPPYEQEAEDGSFGREGSEEELSQPVQQPTRLGPLQILFLLISFGLLVWLFFDVAVYCFTELEMGCF